MLALVAQDIAFTHFSFAGYIPYQLSQSFLNIVKDPLIAYWNKVSFFQSAALLALHEDFSSPCIDYLVFLHTTNPKKDTSYIRSMYTKDLLGLLYTAAVFLPQGQESLANELVSTIMERIRDLSPEEHLGLKECLCALGFLEEAFEVPQHPATLSISKAQKEITEAVKDYIESHPLLSRLSLTSEKEILGRNVDLYLEGFKELGLQQQPIIIEIDGPAHFAFNDEKRRLGSDYLRERCFQYSGCEYVLFNLKNQEEVIASICELLKGKVQEWEEQLNSL